MNKEITPGLKEKFLESCRKIIAQDGSCNFIDCYECPGAGQYNNGIDCDDNGWRKPTHPWWGHDPICKANAEKYIAEHEHKDDGWTYVKTIADIPEPEVWKCRQWQGKFLEIDGSEWLDIDNPIADYVVDILMSENGIEIMLDGEEYELRYRPKDLPSDEWILNRLWEEDQRYRIPMKLQPEGDIFLLRYPGRPAIGVNREWFLTAKCRKMGPVETWGDNA